ncbi:MAG: PhoX family phosphatase [Rhodospirillaceae bacterium]|nr:PhoX family phosphatase [Rhodospirillaceae bacterium]
MSLMERYEAAVAGDGDDRGRNPTDNRPMIEVVEARLSRRGLLGGMLAGLAAGACAPWTGRAALAAGNPSTLTFEEVAHGIDETHHVAKGYTAQVLIRWGDRVAKDAPAFDPARLSAAAQEKQFGYNNDFIGFLPLPQGSGSSDHGLLAVNHEYTNAELMFPDLAAEDKLQKMTRDQVAVEMAAHGHSILEVRRRDGAWTVAADSPYNRRITATTPMALSGPAAGHPLLRTRADPDGRTVLGTINNCAGGVTPWGTVLICEENFNLYFAGATTSLPEAKAYARYGVGESPEYAWSRFVDRFDLAKEPNEPHRFGWVVELDPYDAAAVPVKRTALGRLKHEGATAVLNRDGRVVVYMGDDERFEYIYRFVSAGTYDPANRAANMGLLDVGTLSVARFHDDGRLEWLPLVQGQGPLTPENGFASQADVLIKTRLAADLVGATPMDRPEDVEADPTTGRVYAVLTNNIRRRYDQVDAANPRLDNTAGHIIEMIPPGEGAAIDHAAATYRWDLFLAAGNPVWGGTYYGKGVSDNGWLACPDNLAFDAKGRIWIATDQGGAQPGFGIGDGLYGADVSGDGRAVTRFFFRCPRDAEMCGPCFTPDGRTLFLAVQHPGEGSTFASPSTRWPDFAPDMPPRPAVVAVTKSDGAEVGV